MPYSNLPKEDWAKMDRCVEEVMAKGKSKERAVAICHSAIAGSGVVLGFQAATEEDILALQASLAGSAAWTGAEIPTSEIWKFEGACLARCEVNANRDGITDEGIMQLAETIRLMPLTVEHDRNRPIGVFTKGYTDENSTRCLVDGFIWSGHFPAEAMEIRDGKRQLSIDAEAKLAVCSVCGAAFSSPNEYCEHIRNRESGAVRWLYDLTAVAGGAVRYPAGSGTVFPGKEGFTVISHLTATAEWWKKYWSKESEIPTSSFADKKNRKYPFKGPDGKVDKEGWMAAWKYAHKYNETAVINELKRHLPEGYKLEGDSVVKVTGGGKMQVVCNDCGHEQELVTDAEKLQAELEAKLDELRQAQSKLADTVQALAELETKMQAEQQVVDRFVELAAVAGVEFAREALPWLRKADKEVFEGFKAMASRIGRKDDDEPHLPGRPEPVVASERNLPLISSKDNWIIEI